MALRARGTNWQMLQAPLLAHLLQRPVVHDFRAADLALGGQGAPLVPMADAALLGAASGWRALLNLGGIANLTLIPPGTGPDRQAPVLGWDCGPANTLIDLAVEHFSEGREHVDRTVDAPRPDTSRTPCSTAGCRSPTCTSRHPNPPATNCSGAKTFSDA